MGTQMPGDPNRRFEELQALSLEVQSATDLQRLKAIFYRVQDILQAHPHDAAVQAAANDLKQLVLVRGKRLQDAIAGGNPPPSPPPAAGSYTIDPSMESSRPRGSGGAPASAPPPLGMPTMGSVPPPMPFGPPQTKPPVPPPHSGQPTGQAATQTKTPAKKKAGFDWKLPVAAGVVFSLAIAAGAYFLLPKTSGTSDVKKSEKGVKVADTAPVAVEIRTQPAGAVLTVDGNKPDGADGIYKLKPGTHALLATLDGYEAASGSVTVEASKTPSPVTLTLQAAGQTVRLITDLDTGTATLDGEAPRELQSGEATIEHVAPGEHKVAVKGPRGEASFAFSVEQNGPAKPSAIKAKNLLAILVSSGGGQTTLLSSAATPVRIAIDGQAKGQVGQAPVSLADIAPGEHELYWNEAPTPRKIQVRTTQTPSLSAYLKLDLNAGTLMVVTGEDKAVVSIDGKPLKVQTKNGQLRIPNLAVKNYRVTVAKEGFQGEPEQQAAIRKGEETRIEFKLRPIPKVAGLWVRGAMAGAAVLVDGEQVGKIGADGSLIVSGIAPGDHTVELRAEQHTPKKLQRPFPPGTTVRLEGADVTLAQLLGTLRLAVSPSTTTLSYQRQGEAAFKPVRDTTLTLPEGTYVFQAKAPGYTDRTVTAAVAPGQTKTVDLALTPEKKQPVAAGMDAWMDPKGWTTEGEWNVHKGGGTVLYRISPISGTFTFNAALLKSGAVFKAGKLRWVTNYVDSKNYVLYEMDKKNFLRRRFVEGKGGETVKKPHGLEQFDAYGVKIDITSDAIVTRLKSGGGFTEVDTLSDPAGAFDKGRFGFQIPGSDEVGLASFTFVPR